MYKRKTKDIYIIYGIFENMVEEVARYEINQSKLALNDLREYRNSKTGVYFIKRKREKLEVK